MTVFPAPWENPAHKKSKGDKRDHSEDAQENERAIQANLFSPCDRMPRTSGVVYRAGFVVHAAVKPDQYADADAECECQNDPKTDRTEWRLGCLHFSF